MTGRTKYLLDESQMPTSWYNIIPDLPSPPPPPLHPGTHEPVGPDDLAPLFPMDLILQEVTTERFVDIPGEVQDVYRLWRPSPLYRAHRLEKAVGTPAKIYYKYERQVPQELLTTLKDAADTAAELDERMQRLHRELHGPAAGSARTVAV